MLNQSNFLEERKFIEREGQKIKKDLEADRKIGIK
jgi:hypothetical protein